MASKRAGGLVWTLVPSRVGMSCARWVAGDGHGVFFPTLFGDLSPRALHVSIIFAATLSLEVTR